MIQRDLFKLPLFHALFKMPMFHALFKIPILHALSKLELILHMRVLRFGLNLCPIITDLLSQYVQRSFLHHNRDHFYI